MGRMAMTGFAMAAAALVTLVTLLLCYSATAAPVHAADINAAGGRGSSPCHSAFPVADDATPPACHCLQASVGLLEARLVAEPATAAAPPPPPAPEPAVEPARFPPRPALAALPAYRLNCRMLN